MKNYFCFWYIFNKISVYYLLGKLTQLWEKQLSMKISFKLEVSSYNLYLLWFNLFQSSDEYT